MKAVDVLHEQYRHPTQYFVDKPACMDAKWLGSAARSAKDPHARLTSSALSQLVRCAVSAAAAGAAVALLITHDQSPPTRRLPGTLQWFSAAQWLLG
jgi:hypothetical protein